MRKISKTLAVIGLLTPAGVNALGIGDIKLQSALNQSLRAEIPLVTSGSESLDDIKIGIASNEAFAKAGVERNQMLSRLRFTAVKRPDGGHVIQVSSQEPIREPFLNFLIEVNWPQGRVLREFTVLLDPPAAYKEETVASPTLPETAAPSLPRGRARMTEAQVGGAWTEGRPGQDAGGPSRAQTARQSGAEYGPVQRNETLWSIAKLIERPAGVTQEQMVVAIYQANPQAFYKGSLNALKAGETLRIPDRDALVRLSPQEARAQIFGQPAPRAGKLSEKTERPPVAKEAQVPEQEGLGKLKLLAPTDTKGKTDTAAPGAHDESAKAKSDIALEVADTVKQENEEIRSRLAQLEQQLSGMQRLLTVKDEQIASMQAQGKALATPAASSTTTAPAPENIPAPSGQVETPRTLASDQQPTVTPSAPAAPAMSSPRVETAPVAPKPQKPVPPPAPPVPSVEEPGFISFLMDEPLFLGVGGLGVGLLGLYFWRGFKRRAALTDESESILAVPRRDRLVEPTGTGVSIPDQTPSEQVAPAARSSFLSEFSTSDFDALGGEVDEVDPISEADVYLAYGRYKQAEELIRHAIGQYPDRDECKLKLLEIQYATENRPAFEAYAKELFNENKDANPDFWDKVVEMGRELCPDSPLFGQQDFIANSATQAQVSEEDLSASLDLDEDLLAELKNFENDDSKYQEKSHDTDVLDFDVSKQEAKETVKSDVGSLAEIDFETPAVPAIKSDEAEASIDFANLIQFETPSTASTDDSQIVQMRPDKTLDDILLEMGAISESSKEDLAVASTDAHMHEQSSSGSTDDFSLDFSVIKPPSLDSQNAFLADDEAIVGLDDQNEFETRLDLAKAFVDMGDEDSARQILLEIVKSGSEAQRKEAKALLDKISA